jgi:hypothetical protein
MALLISLTIFTAGCLYTWLRWGVQKSISITFYEHENKAVWWAWMLSFSIPILFVAPHWLMLIAVTGIVIVGSAGDYRSDPISDAWHNAGAVIGIVAAFAYLGFVQGQWWVVGIMAAFTVYARLRLNNSTNWIEVAAMYLTILGLAL